MGLVNRFTDADTRIEPVVYFYRADSDAVPTAIAEILIDITGILSYADQEMPSFTLDPGHFAAGMDHDPGMTGDIEHLRGKDTHRTVVCGKGLVKLGHVTANRGLALDNVHPDTVPGKIKRSLDTGYPSTDDDHIAHQR